MSEEKYRKLLKIKKDYLLKLNMYMKMSEIFHIYFSLFLYEYFTGERKEDTSLTTIPLLQRFSIYFWTSFSPK